MSKRRSSWGKGWFGWLATAGIFLGAALPSTGCTTETIPGDECVGGVVVDGRCEAKCDPAKCLEGNVCVDNRCKLICDEHEDCFPGYQVCREKLTDEDENGVQVKVAVCDDSGQIPAVGQSGFPEGWWGLDCPFGDTQCAAQTACPDGTPCTTAPSCTCELDEAACGEDARCNKGKCAEDGAACIFNRCTVAECQPLRCVGFAGEGDALAYCSLYECDTDDQCQPGFYCGTDRDPTDICNDDTNPDFQDALCGASSEPCVDPATAGPAYSAGTICLMRKTCLKRDECAPCSENLDCSFGDGDLCAAHAGDNVCARICNDDSNCSPDEACVPYAPSTAKATGAPQTCGASPHIDCIDPAVDCPTPGDTCVPRNVCVPRSGKCDGSDLPAGDGKFCAHCLRDTDCGPADSGWVCEPDDNGDNHCFDRSFPWTCGTDADCPLAPSGRNGHCITANDPFGSNLVGRCWIPERAAPFTGSFGCWDK